MRDGLRFWILVWPKSMNLSARSESETLSLATEPGRIMGTVGYMSPEQVRGQPVDHRTDLFAFGAILHEMVAGQRAFHAPTAIDTVSAILNQDPPELADAGINGVVRRCLEKDRRAAVFNRQTISHSCWTSFGPASCSSPATRGTAASETSRRAVAAVASPNRRLRRSRLPL